MYRDYDYGCRKKEVKVLLNKRLDLKKKLRRHKAMIEQIDVKVSEYELEIDKYLK